MRVCSRQEGKQRTAAHERDVAGCSSGMCVISDCRVLHGPWSHSRFCIRFFIALDSARPTLVDFYRIFFTRAGRFLLDVFFVTNRSKIISASGVRFELSI